MFYHKVPWELGYPFYEEIDAIMPVIDKTVAQIREEENKKSGPNLNASADWENIRRGNIKRDSLGSGSSY
ncbi:hypothetical protein [Glutamicibacter sp.]|jgi:hypothetical protein|uniref:hypothetical protein n=1 Tax=Glutamicibacter sp. TaxID=1931995 RepID=UPI002B46F593|nr:hypothetical protein [Glutamicibacter sp.]HJX79137.1 hypothetical protein [Glutamicibacter sp.]